MLSVTKDQLKIMQDDSRFRVVVAGRRWGKTHMAILDDLFSPYDGLYTKPNSLIWYVAPTYRQGKMIAWHILKQFAYKYPQYLKKKPNESELSIEIINNSRYYIKGADKEDSLRGSGLNKITLDETSIMKPDAYYEVLRPALSDKKGRATFIGTPDGFGMFYDVYMKGVNKEDGYNSYHFKTIDSPFIDVEEVEQAKRELDPRTFRQEYEASFETVSGRVYYAFDRTENNTDTTYNPNLPIKLCADFNVNPMCWTIIQTPKSGFDIAVDEIIQENTNTIEMAKEVARRYGEFVKGYIYGDYSGNSRDTRTYTTDFEIMQNILPALELKIKPHTPVVDRVNATNARACNYNGDRRYFVNTTACPNLTRDYEQVVYKEGKREIDKSDARRTHSSDGVDYYFEYEYSLKGKTVGRQKW